MTLPYPKALEKYGITGSVTLAKKPERVVALTNTPVLTLHALGVNLVGIPATKIVQWPEDLKQHAKEFQTGMRSNIDLEGVIALQPDLVIVGYHARDTYGKILEREKIPVYYVDAGPTVSYDSIKELTLILVDAFGKESEAGMKIKERFQQVEKEMENARQQNQGKRVMVLQAAPPRFYLQNKNGTVGSMLQLLGFTNVAPEMGAPWSPWIRKRHFPISLIWWSVFRPWRGKMSSGKPWNRNSGIMPLLGSFCGHPGRPGHLSAQVVRSVRSLDGWTRSRT